MRRFPFLCIISVICSPAFVDAQWLNKLPGPARQSILWSADHEEGSLDDWAFPNFQHAGGGILNTGDDEVWAVASNRISHSGMFSAEATITNAYRAQNGNRAVRLMRWTDRPWDNGGDYLPREAFYSTWLYMPVAYNPNKYAPWDPGDGGWWNIFQFKADDADGNSQPMFTLNVYHHDSTGQMELYLYTAYNEPRSRPQPHPKMLPAGKWVHIEAFYRADAGNEGQIVIWQDGTKILDERNVRTAMIPSAERAVWGIGNYTDHIAGGPKEGTATIYFDDSAISTARLSRFAGGAAIQKVD